VIGTWTLTVFRASNLSDNGAFPSVSSSLVAAMPYGVNDDRFFSSNVSADDFFSDRDLNSLGGLSRSAK
jgi:hypothetical protein